MSRKQPTERAELKAQIEREVSNLIDKFGGTAVVDAARRLVRRTNKPRGSPPRHAGDLAGIYAYVEAHRQMKIAGRERGIGGACRHLLNRLGPYANPSISAERLEKLYYEGAALAARDEAFRTQVWPLVDLFKTDPAKVVLLAGRRRADGSVRWPIDTRPPGVKPLGDIEITAVTLNWASKSTRR
jgi:hypothetical protein